MQEFHWPFSYSAIFMVWCAGYLCREELIVFLRKAQVHLLTDGVRATRQSAPKSFIFVVENVRDEGEVAYTHKGQSVRTKKELETIFAEAGLAIHRTSGPSAMPGKFGEICLWALY